MAKAAASRVAVPTAASAARGARSSDAASPGRPPKSSGAAARDPRFLRLLAQVQRNAAQQKKHPPAAQKAADAQAAAKAPANEAMATAKANQVGVLAEVKTEPPKTDGFLALLRAEIAKVMPQTQGDTQNFLSGGDKEQVKSAVRGGVESSRANATQPMDKAVAAPPNPKGIVVPKATPIPADPAAPTPAIDARDAVPPPRSDAEISQQKFADAGEARMKAVELNDAQLQKANDPRFSAVLGAKRELQASVAATPGRYRGAEGKVSALGIAGARVDARVQLAGMTHARKQGGAQVKTRQELARVRDEKRRKAVADRLEGIYQRTKKTVELKLSTLETDVMAAFDAGLNVALASMKAWTDVEIKKFKEVRYAGVSGKAQWALDLFRACPPEIQAILGRGRERFAKEMDALAVTISTMVDKRLAEARAEIKRGQGEIATEVAKLPADLKGAGKAAAAELQGRFKELEDGVEAKKQALAEGLAKRYKEAHDKADAELKKVEKANEGKLKALGDKIEGALKVISEFKAKLTAILRKGQQTIKLIIADPIGFLGNLIAAVKGGVMAFVGNFKSWLLKGLAQWLFGSLAQAGISMPTDLSLASIFKLVMQILGITYAGIRAKAVKLVGEPVVKTLETMAEFIKIFVKGGAGALWEHIKEKLSDLKSMVLDAIIGWVKETIITQATIKLLSMLNPAGAFVQACIAIYNAVMFLIERASQILAFIEAVVNSVHSIATGAIGGAIRWIEQALGRTVPLVISFLARLIGLGGITDKVVKIIKAVQAKVDKAIDWLIGKVVGGLKKLFGRNKKGDAEGRKGELEAAIAEASGLVKASAEPKSIESKLGAIKTKFRLSALDLKSDGTLGPDLKMHFVAKGSPVVTSPSFVLKGWSDLPVGVIAVPRTSVRWTDRLKRTVYRRWVKRVGVAEASKLMDKTGTFKPGAPISVHRRHVISFKNYKDHLQNNLSAMTIDKAAESLHNKQVKAVMKPKMEPEPKHEPQRRQIEEGARELANRFNNDASNIWIGNAIENIQRKWMVDPSPKIEGGKAGVEAALAKHIQKMEAKYALPGKSLEVSTPFGVITWQLVISMAPTLPPLPTPPGGTIGPIE